MEYNKEKWYKDYLYQISRIFRYIWRHKFTILLIIFVYMFLKATIYMLIIQRNVVLTDYNKVSYKEVEEIINIGQKYFIFQWFHHTLSDFLLMLSFLVFYLAYIFIHFLLNLFYRLIVRVDISTSIKYNDGIILLRKSIGKVYNVLIIIIILIAGVTIAPTIYNGGTLEKVVNLIGVNLIVGSIIIFIVTYAHIYSKYKKAILTERENIKTYLFSKHSVHQTFIDFMSAIIFLGILGYFLFPLVFFVIKEIALILTKNIILTSNYQLIWNNILQYQEYTLLPNPKNMYQSFDSFSSISNAIEKREILVIFQKMIFKIVLIMFTGLISSKAIMNIVFNKRDAKKLKKIIIIAIYTFITTVILTVFIKNIYLIEIDNLSIFGIIFSILLNIILTAQTL